MKDNSETEVTTEGGEVPASESRSVYEAIFQEMGDAVFLIDVEHSSQKCTFNFRRNNASHRQLTGLSVDELRGQTPREVLGDEQGAVVAENYRRCVERGETIEYEKKTRPTRRDKLLADETHSNHRLRSGHTNRRRRTGHNTAKRAGTAARTPPSAVRDSYADYVCGSISERY